MFAVINDISFRYPFSAAETAIGRMHEFLDICISVEKKEITNVQEIKTDCIDVQREISPGYKLIQLIQEFREREERSLLISVLTNRGTYKSEENAVCKILDEESNICGAAVDNFLVSLRSHPVFDKAVVEAEIESNCYELRNLSQKEHLDFYRKELGRRRYIANDIKHKFGRENPYGKGKIASRMDLHKEDAQELLNRAAEIDGRLYAKKDGFYYAFQNERDIDYHGYRADDLADGIKRQLDKIFA